MPEPTSPTPSPDKQESAPPMTSKMLARLFIVPALIVAMIIGSSVMVVLLFGWITTSREESIDKLVSRIEAGAGEKVIGVALLPRDKEVWQAAMELADRLRSDDPKVIPPEDRPLIAQRLEAILKPTQTIKQTEMGQQMQEFLLTALGRLGQSSSVDVLISFAVDPQQPVNVRWSALSGLVLLRREPAAKQAIHELVPLLESPEGVLRVAATAAIGTLAEPDDIVARDALTRAYRSADREVVWNATLALAHLGHRLAAPTLRDMLVRSYWESVELESGQPVPAGSPARHLTPVQVDGYLMLTMNAAEALGDPSLRAPLERLREDPSPQVRDLAVKVIQQWDRAPESAPTSSSRKVGWTA